MGILRTDRVSGLGGANAIKGSVFFGNNLDSTGGATGFDYLITERSSNFTFGTGDITIEGWFFFPRLSSSTDYQALVGDTFYYDYGGGSNNGFTFYVEDAQIHFWNDVTGSLVSGGTIVQNEWTHLAYTRESGSNKIFVNGSLVGTASDSTNYTDTALTIGVNKVGQTSGSDAGQFPFSGFASNVRVLKGRALYTAAFTPPVGELQVIDNTVLLCCQSPGNVLQEATGVILTAPRINNSAGAQASRFTPNSPVGFSTTTDVGTQFGSTFDGVTTFDSQAYMVVPGGNTRERNRGRAIFAGGVASPYKDIQVVDISSGGIAQDFGDTTSAAPNNGSASSSTRMLVTIGGTPAVSNIIEFITIANIANSTDFGDLTEPRRRTQSLSNSTRAVHVGGTSASPASLYRNEIDFNTIATAGNATDFGDTLAAHVATGGSVASSTRGVYSVGYLNGSYVNTLEFITIASTGNGQDFGDLNGGTIGYHFRGSTCDSTRGLFSGGYNPSAEVQNKIDFITIATTGNATDFGDLSLARRSGGGTSNSIHSIFAGGYLPGVNNTIDRVLIQTTGNAVDFGDFVVKTHENSGSSDSHGGLE